MRWQEGGESENVEDQRQLPVGMALGGAGTMIVVVIALLLGRNPRALLQQVQNRPPRRASGRPSRKVPKRPARSPSSSTCSSRPSKSGPTCSIGNCTAPIENRSWFCSPRRVNSACGLADAAVGPFYCPADQKVYIDLEFYDELKNRFHAGGDFANAYVIAHEVGHHVQNLMGISIESKHRKLPRDTENQLSVRLELQADFLAGVWAHYADQKWQILEAGDVEKAITAAQAIGDDRLQKQAQGYVVPEKFTHGTSQQRAYWFNEGLKNGNLKEADRLFLAPYDEL